MSAQDTPTGNGAAPTGALVHRRKAVHQGRSFEAPGAPQVFNEQGQPQLQMNLNQRVHACRQSLRSRPRRDLTCTIGDKTAYLAEVQQAGVFGLSGFDEMTLEVMLGTHCPNALYPYARQTVSDLIQPAASRRSCCSRSISKPCTPRACASAPQQAGGGLAGTETVGNA